MRFTAVLAFDEATLVSLRTVGSLLSPSALRFEIENRRHISPYPGREIYEYGCDVTPLGGSPVLFFAERLEPDDSALALGCDFAIGMHCRRLRCKMRSLWGM